MSNVRSTPVSPLTRWAPSFVRGTLNHVVEPRGGAGGVRLVLWEWCEAGRTLDVVPGRCSWWMDAAKSGPGPTLQAPAHRPPEPPNMYPTKEAISPHDCLTNRRNRNVTIIGFIRPNDTPIGLSRKNGRLSP